MRDEIGQSPEEIFDIVDDHDCVVGSLSRDAIHQQGLKHRAVHIFWLRSDGLLCLQKRSYAKDKSPGLISTSCAGHLDSGETYLKAAVREFREEMGITIMNEQLLEIDYVPAHRLLGNEFVRVYLLRGDFTCRLHKPEVDSVLWRTPRELKVWSSEQTEIFATPLLFLLERPAIRRALGLG